MGKRVFLFWALVSMLLSQPLEAQNEIVSSRTEHGVGKAYQVKQATIPWQPNPLRNFVHEKGHFGTDPSPRLFDASQMEGEHGEKVAATNAFIVNVGRNFEGNHLTGGTPSDNTMAISNGGIIVSADNYSIAYFKENGDTITQFGLPHTLLYNDSTMSAGMFDPRVLYDRIEDRFILVSLFVSNDFKDSRALISFSKPLVADTVEWQHYHIDCDSIFTGAGEGMYWFDYPNISVSRSQLLLTLNVRKHDSTTNTNSSATNVVFQVDKAAGYTAGPSLVFSDWRNVENTENVRKITWIPAMDALQGVSYDTVTYFVANYADNSSKFFWFELNGAVGSPTAQITQHATFPSFFYQTATYASQLGGNGGDRISVLDCDIQYCLLQNGKLHFVLTRADNDWVELVYANIEILTNTFFSSSFDRVTDSENLMRPSIACYGVDSTDENYLIGFLRTGPNQFPEICAINYDSTGWSIAPTSVKTGHGILDLRRDLVAPWDSLERWGDYTCIQRRYDDPFRRCWMVGAHAFGLTANHFGRLSGVNAWISELGDSLPALEIPGQAAIQGFQLLPNPTGGNGIVKVHLPRQTKGFVQIVDAFGKQVLSMPFASNSIEISLPSIPAGMYFVSVVTNREKYETKKLVVLR